MEFSIKYTSTANEELRSANAGVARLHENSPVQRRENVKPVGRHERGRLGADRRCGPSGGAGTRVDGFDQARIPDCHVDETTRRIEERCVRNSGQRPLAAHVSGERVELDEHATVACNVEKTRLVIDVEPVRADRRKHPVPHLIEFGQPRRQDDRGLADREEHARTGSIRDAPPGPPGKVDRPPLLPPEFHDLELGAAGFVADAGNHRQLQARDDGNPVRARAGVEHGPRFHTVTIELCQTRCSAVGYEHMARIGHHAGRLRKARQGHEVSAAVMLDDLDAVARRKRHEDAAGLRVKGSMVEKGRSRTGYLDHSHGSQRHGGLLPTGEAGPLASCAWITFSGISRTRVLYCSSWSRHIARISRNAGSFGCSMKL